MAIIIDGKSLSEKIIREKTSEIRSLKKKPGLAVLVVGNVESSKIYIRNKEQACKETGIYFEKRELPENAKEKELLEAIESLNKNKKIHGILVQLPLPKHIDKGRIIESVDLRKDVDGFHPINLGRLLEGDESLVPCTPKGVIRILENYKIPIEGRHAVVIGRSLIVGKPLSMLLLSRNATLTICHSKTKNLSEITRQAEILVSAVGKPNMITAGMVKKNAVVIDIGITRIDGKVVGDVDFEHVKDVASYITPVPGGVGPMTVAMLLENMIKCYRNIEK